MPPGIDLDKLRAAERMGELRNPEGIQPLLIAGLLEPVRKAEPGEPPGPWRITDKGRAALRKSEGE